MNLKWRIRGLIIISAITGVCAGASIIYWMNIPILVGALVTVLIPYFQMKFYNNMLRRKKNEIKN